jgi:protoporphyrinogen IX oxidase
VFKNQLPTDITAWAVLGMIIAFTAIIQLYARKRRLDQEKQAALTAEVGKMEAS